MQIHYQLKMRRWKTNKERERGRKLLRISNSCICRCRTRWLHSSCGWLSSWAWRRCEKRPRSSRAWPTRFAAVWRACDGTRAALVACSTSWTRAATDAGMFCLSRCHRATVAMKTLLLLDWCSSPTDANHPNFCTQQLKYNNHVLKWSRRRRSSLLTYEAWNKYSAQSDVLSRKTNCFFL